MPYVRNFDGSSWPPLCWDLSGGTQTVLQNGSDYMEGNYWSWTAGNYALATTQSISITSDARLNVSLGASVQFQYPNDQMLILIRLVSSSSWDTLVNHIGPAFSSLNATNTAPPPDTDFTQEIINLDPSKYTGNDVVFQMIFNSGYGPSMCL